MKIYVLTYTNGTVEPWRNILNGCYGVFSTLNKAQLAAIANINDDGNEIILDYKNDTTRGMFLYFTNYGTWSIEEMKLDDAGIL